MPSSAGGKNGGGQVTQFGKMIQGFKDSRFKDSRFKDARIQDSWIQGFKIHGFKDSRI